MEQKGNFGDFSRGLDPKQGVGVVLLFLVVILVAWGALTSFYTVETDEVGIVLRFGKYQSPPTDPGLHFKLPFGIDRVRQVKVDRVHKLEFGYETKQVRQRGRTAYQAGSNETTLMLTGDQNVVSVEWIVQYKISDPEKYLFRIAHPEETIRDLAESTMRLVVGDSSATEALTARRQEIAYEVQTRLQGKLDKYESGIEVRTVELQNVVPPTKEVEDSFNEVNRARQEKETRINEARREFQKAIPEAQGLAKRLVTEAEGYKLKRVNEARGDVAKFLALLGEYETSKEVTRQRLYLEAMEDALPSLTAVYVIDDTSVGPLQVLDLKAMGAATRLATTGDETAGGTKRPPVRQSTAERRR